MPRTTGLRKAGSGLLIGVAVALTAPATPALDLNGFLREKGEGDVAVSFTSEGYDEFWVGDQKVSDPGVGEVDTRSVSVWLAYGITPDLTVVATLPWVDSEGDGLGGFRESDFQDATVMGVYRLGAAGGSTHSQFLGGLGVRTPASDYEPNLPVDVGDGTTDWLVRFVYQLQHGAFYWSQQVGYDIRGEDAPDGLLLYTEVGYTWGRTTINGSFSKLLADGGTNIGDPGFTFPSNEEENERAGGKVYVRLTDRYGVAAGAFTTLDGRNTGDASGASLAFNIGF